MVDVFDKCGHFCRVYVVLHYYRKCKFSKYSRFFFGEWAAFCQEILGCLFSLFRAAA
jgi:hypothetical protein